LSEDEKSGGRITAAANLGQPASSAAVIRLIFLIEVYL
jgi:hypothetical protein